MDDKAKKENIQKMAAALKAKKPERPPLLQTDQVIAGQSGCRYLIEGMLGKGGFGEVYKVSPLADPDKKYAMKVEKSEVGVGKHAAKMLRLKVEILVFDTLMKDTVEDKTHFMKMHDKGRTETFKYYVMDLIWLSLKDCVEQVCKGVLSSHAKVIIARQTLKGIETLHNLGFLHRDVKWHNFAVGLPPSDNIIYCIDFGIARPYRDKDGGVLIPRARVEFLGSPCYASIACQEYREQGRKDDLESWMYMMLELYDVKNLPWAEIRDKKKVVDMKKRLMVHPDWCKGEGTLKAPEQYTSMIRHISSMKYEDAGNFKIFNELLDNLVKQDKIDEKLPLDWVGKRPKSPEKPKKIEPVKVEKKKEVKKERKKESKKADEGSVKDYDFPPESKMSILPPVEDCRDYDDEEDSDSDDLDSEEEYEEFLRMKRRRKRRGSRKRSRDHKSPRKRSHRRRESSNERKEKTDKKRRNSKKRTKESHGKPKKDGDGGMEEEAKIPEKEARDDKNAEKDLKKKEEEKPIEGRKKESKIVGEAKGMDKPADVKEKREKELDKKADPKSPVAQSPVDNEKKAAEAAPVKKEPADKKK